MSTQTFDESRHPRSVTGKFAAKEHTEADGGLQALAEQDANRKSHPAPVDRSKAQDAYTSSLQKFLALRERTEAMAALSVALNVRAVFPHAATVDLEYSDQGDWYYAIDVRDGEGNSIGDFDDVEEASEADPHPIYDVSTALTDIGLYGPGVSDYKDEKGRRRKRFDLDQAQANGQGYL